jgi:hypothetical protein
VTTTVDAGAAPVTQAAVLENLSGSSAPGCAVVGQKADVRAGALAIGSFVDMRKSYAAQAKTKAQPEISMYVIPQHVKPESGVSVLLESLQGKGRRTAKASVAQTAGDWRYYRVNLAVPAAGSWRITAVSGGDRGCFEVTFGR